MGRSGPDGHTRVGDGDSDRAQSEAIGAIMLIGLVVVGMTVTGVLALATFSDGTMSNEPLLSLEPHVNETSLTLVHGGGNAVGSDDLTVILRSDGGETSYTIDESTVEGDGDGTFEPGERSTKAHGSTGGPLRIVVVDTAADRVVLNVETTINGAETTTTET